MSGDHNMHQKPRSYLDDFECPRCGHCCQIRQAAQQAVKVMDDHMMRADTDEFYEAKEALSQALETDLARVGEVGVWGEWQGLTLNEAEDFYEKYTDRAELINAIDKFLEEKNT